MPRAKKCKRPFKFCYVQDWGPFLRDTFVVVRMGRSEIIRAMTRRRFAKHYIDAFSQASENCTFDSPFTWRRNCITLLWLCDWKDDWDHWGDLVHESNHLVRDVLGKAKGLQDEYEAQAYQQEYLFHAIRKQLSKALQKSRRSK